MPQQKSSNTATYDGMPMLKTVEQMSKVSGIGANKLRQLIESGELEYIQNGNRRLLMDSFVIDWIQRARRPVLTIKEGAHGSI